MGPKPTIIMIFAIFGLLLSVSASYATDPCLPVKQWKAQVKAQAGVDVKVKCIPLTAALNWEVDERLDRHSGFASDTVNYKLCEAYPAYLQINYNQAGSMDSFLISGPSPQEKNVIKIKLNKIKATYLACQPFAENCKTFSTKNVEDFTVGLDPLSDGIDFSYKQLDGAIGDITASKIEPKDTITAETYHIRSTLPEHITGIVEGIHVKGKDAFSLQDIKKFISKGFLAKSFKIGKVVDYPTREGYAAAGNVDVKLFAGGKLKKQKQRVSYEDCDPYCPNKFCSKVCYDIEVDPCISEVKITVKVKLNKKKAVPYKKLDVFETPKGGSIAVYVGPVTPGGVKPTPVEISDSKLEQLKKEYEVHIEGAWNDKYDLVSDGGKVKMNFDVVFVDSGDFCHEVDVLPGEGRSDTSNWYAEEFGFFVAHEFGHFIGLNDEYYAPHECPKRPKPKDDTIMNDETNAPAPRHYKPVVDWLGKATGVKWKTSN